MGSLLHFYLVPSCSLPPIIPQNSADWSAEADASARAHEALNNAAATYNGDTDDGKAVLLCVLVLAGCVLALRVQILPFKERPKVVTRLLLFFAGFALHPMGVSVVALTYGVAR